MLGKASPPPPPTSCPLFSSLLCHVHLCDFSPVCVFNCVGNTEQLQLLLLLSSSSPFSAVSSRALEFPCHPPLVSPQIIIWTMMSWRKVMFHLMKMLCIISFSDYPPAPSPPPCISCKSCPQCVLSNIILPRSLSSPSLATLKHYIWNVLRNPPPLSA